MGILILVILGVGVYYFIKGQQRDTKDTTNKEQPIDLLKKRLALGEISEEDYTIRFNALNRKYRKECDLNDVE